MIGQLMTYARPPEPRRRAVTVAEVVRLTGGAADLPADLSPLDIDPDQIAAALTAVLDNARRFGETVTLTAEAAGAAVRLTVADDGPGMPPEVLARCRDPFYSHQPAGRRRGMGLALAARLLDANGGRLDVQSMPGAGTTVTLELPVIR